VQFDLDELMTISEAMKVLGIKSRATIYRWSKSGKLPIYKKSGKSWVKKEDVDRVQKEFGDLRPLHQK
jgi:excisionase family DNA binding protein